MTNKSNPGQQDAVQIAIDILIKLGALLLLLIWCFQIIRPFISIVIWSLIIAVSLFPLFRTMAANLGNRKKLAATILTVLMLSIIVVPALIFTDSLVDGMQRFNKDLDAESLTVPPPPAEVAEWPLVGNVIHDTWQLASESLEQTMEKFSPQLKTLGTWVLEALMGTGMGLLQLLLSIIISGLFLVYSDQGGRMIRNLFQRLTGSRGDEFSKASEVTIRNVSKGVLGVSLIQSFLAGIVFLAAGVPYAGLWALIALILCIIQLGPGLVIIPVIIYLFTVSSTWVAIIWTVVLILVMLSDNILKPILMGKGAPVPMMVIFLGSIGGFISMGFIGLFLGAVILSLGYKLFLLYVQDPEKVVQAG